MFKQLFLLMFPVLLATACSNTGGQDRESAAMEDASAATNEEADSRELCYASRTEAATDLPGENFNYEFIHLTIDGEEVRGSMRYYPYGTDKMEASLTGVYKASTDAIHVQADMLAEGELYQQSRSFKLLDNAIQMDYDDAQQQAATVPQVSCEEYDTLLDEFQSGILQQTVNTTDRSRLLKINAAALNEMGLTKEQLHEVNFLERAVDLDRDYQTNEYLLYIMDPMLCGTGGCNLLVIDEQGKILSQTTVVKLPVYTTASTSEDLQNNKGAWKELYVWSQGLRRLSPDDNGTYPENASVEPPVVEEQIALHPERYRLLLDYLDK